MDEFKIYFPESLKELFEYLSADSVILNGGTDLMVRKRLGRLNKKTIISMDKISGLEGISDEGDFLRIFAKTTHSEILNSKLVREYFPMLSKAVSEIGSPQIRNRGTLSGNLANASPAGDGILPLYLADALVIIRSETEEKEIPVSEFVKGPGKTVLNDREFIHSIKISKSYSEHSFYFKKVGQRKAMAISIASIGVLYKLKDGLIDEFLVAFGSVFPTILRITVAEKWAVGKPFSEDTMAEIGKFAFNSVSPIDDVRATALYRKSVCANLPLEITAD